MSRAKRSIQLQNNSLTRQLDQAEFTLVRKLSVYSNDHAEILGLEAEIVNLCNQIASELLQQDNLEKVGTYLKRAEELANHCQVHQITVFNNYSIYYRRLRKDRIALKYIEKAIQKQDNPSTRLNYCAILSQLNRHQQAMEQAMLAVIMCQQKIMLAMEEGDYLGEIKTVAPTIAVAFYNLGVELEFLNKLPECLDYYNQAVEFAQEFMSSDRKLLIMLTEARDQISKKMQIQVNRAFWFKNREFLKTITVSEEKPAKPVQPVQLSQNITRKRVSKGTVMSQTDIKVQKERPKPEIDVQTQAELYKPPPLPKPPVLGFAQGNPLEIRLKSGREDNKRNIKLQIASNSEQVNLLKKEDSFRKEVAYRPSLLIQSAKVSVDISQQRQIKALSMDNQSLHFLVNRKTNRILMRPLIDIIIFYEETSSEQGDEVVELPQPEQIQPRQPRLSLALHTGNQLNLLHDDQKEIQQIKTAHRPSLFVQSKRFSIEIADNSFGSRQLSVGVQRTDIDADLQGSDLDSNQMFVAESAGVGEMAVQEQVEIQEQENVMLQSEKQITDIDMLQDKVSAHEESVKQDLEEKEESSQENVSNILNTISISQSEIQITETVYTFKQFKKPKVDLFTKKEKPSNLYQLSFTTEQKPNTPPEIIKKAIYKLLKLPICEPYYLETFTDTSYYSIQTERPLTGIESKQFELLSTEKIKLKTFTPIKVPPVYIKEKQYSLIRHPVIKPEIIIPTQIFAISSSQNEPKSPPLNPEPENPSSPQEISNLRPSSSLLTKRESIRQAQHNLNILLKHRQSLRHLSWSELR